MARIKKPVKRVRKPVEKRDTILANEIGEPIVDESNDKPTK